MQQSSAIHERTAAKKDPVAQHFTTRRKVEKGVVTQYHSTSCTQSNSSKRFCRAVLYCMEKVKRGAAA